MIGRPAGARPTEVRRVVRVIVLAAAVVGFRAAA